MNNKDYLVNGLDDMSAVMSEKVDRKQKIILKRWTLIVLICTIIILLLKVLE